MEPSWRKPFGIFVMLAIITVMMVIAVMLMPFISGLHWTLQALCYILLGIIWIMPLKPLLRWMETGIFRD
jgi:predicted membrane channel-forming protein YqfA (hemolysin III family)